jgi:thioredoxin reductase (NADPH)
LLEQIHSVWGNHGTDPEFSILLPFILTGAAVAQSPEWQKMSRLPEPLETSRPGVFAAGDVRSGSVKRCAAAVGEGGTAIENVHRSLAAHAIR